MNAVFNAEYECERFKVIYDEEALRKEIRSHNKTEEEYEDEGNFVRISTDENLSYQEYTQEVADFEQAFDTNITEMMLLNAISSFPKKKNGTFNRKTVIAIKRLNASYYSEEEYGWPCEELRFKAIDDNTLEMTIKRNVIGY